MAMLHDFPHIFLLGYFNFEKAETHRSVQGLPVPWHSGIIPGQVKGSYRMPEIRQMPYLLYYIILACLSESLLKIIPALLLTLKLK